MRKLLGLASLAGVGFPLTAIAQPPPPPPPAPYYAPAPAPAAATEPKMRFEGGLMMAIPQGDLSDGAESSLGIGLVLGANVAPNISVFGGFRYIKITTSNQSEVDFAHYDLLGGVRFTTPVSPTAKLFAEGHLGFATFSVSSGGESASESGIGFGARAGMIFMMGHAFGLGAGLGYSTASIDFGGEDSLDDSWLTLEAFAHMGF